MIDKIIEERMESCLRAAVKIIKKIAEEEQYIFKDNDSTTAIANSLFIEVSKSINMRKY